MIGRTDKTVQCPVQSNFISKLDIGRSAFLDCWTKLDGFWTEIGRFKPLGDYRAIGRMDSDMTMSTINTIADMARHRGIDIERLTLPQQFDANITKEMRSNAKRDFDVRADNPEVNG